MLDFMGGAAGPDQNEAGKIPYPVEIYATPILDLTVAQLGIELVPAKPGYFAVAITSQWIIEKASGTQATGANIQAGTNAAHTDVITPTVGRPQTADVNGANPPSIGTGAVLPAVTFQRTTNTPTFFDVTSPAIGTAPGFVLLARFCIVVRWYATGGT